MSVLSRSARLPLYHQLERVLLREIEGGRWRAGDRLPTEDELARRFKVSKITVRQALRDLADRGLIRREQGRGTFVERPRMQHGPRQLTSFTEEMRRYGLAPRSRVLEQGVVPAGPSVAVALGIAEGSPVFTLRRLRLADGEPIAVQAASLPVDLVPGIADVAFGDASLYEILQSRYGLDPAAGRETYRVVILEREEADLLGVRPGTPGIGVERVTSLADGRKFECVQSVIRSDRYAIVVELSKHAV